MRRIIAKRLRLMAKGNQAVYRKLKAVWNAIPRPRRHTYRMEVGLKLLWKQVEQAMQVKK